MSDILADHDAVALAELVSSGEATPSEITEAAIARIEALNPQLNAVIYPMFEKALAEASSPDLPDGPFKGVPMLLKDLSSATSAGDPNHLGMRGLRQADYIHPSDSELTSSYRKAGFVMAGRTNTPELGLMPTTEPLAYGPTRNPWNTDYGAGGSSGGAAAAVASGMVPAANASDGGGSIRIPAAMCGLVGLKPTRGRVPMEKASNVYVLSVQHVVCHTMRDAAAILDVSAHDGGGIALPAEPFAASVGKDPGKLRIGLMAASPREGIELHPECEAAARKTADLLESLGHSVEEVYLDLVSEESIAAFGVIWSYGVAADFGMIRERLGRDLEEDRCRATDLADGPARQRNHARSNRRSSQSPKAALPKRAFVVARPRHPANPHHNPAAPKNRRTSQHPRRALQRPHAGNPLCRLHLPLQHDRPARHLPASAPNRQRYRRLWCHPRRVGKHRPRPPSRLPASSRLRKRRPAHRRRLPT